MVAEREVDGSIHGERVVISGMSGLYPESEHVKELSKILYDKKNPVTNENIRWKYSHPEMSDYTGKAPGLDRFDAQFFKVHYRMAESMDAMSKKLLEQTYQAIYDAGVCTTHLSGKKVGVYIGNANSEIEKSVFYAETGKTGFGIMGCSRTMFANRISYWLNLKGPSMAVDQACSSGIGALEQAFQAMCRGDCEAAIVGSSFLSLHPQSSVAFGRTITLSMDGKTRSFDQHAEGCAKSEAINVLFLQKAKDALRIYAELLHVQSEYRTTESRDIEKFGFYRNPEKLANFINAFYEKAKVSPRAVEYVEAFGSGTPEADKAELEAIEKVYCKDRSDPLLVGSVMSNIGYTEAASGLSSITKVLLGYHTGQLAANLNCETPRQDIASLNSGRMRIVTEHTLFRRSYAAVNSMSTSGINGHVLLHGHYKPKDLKRYSTSIPHLVTLSGRQESGVQLIINDLKSRPIDPEELALLHNIHQTRISGHLGRGFTILDIDEEQKTISRCEKVDYFDDAKRPLWFVYSGMGSQWAGMGAQLMRIPIFAAAIERCHKVLEPKGVDIVHIITTDDKTIFDNILHSFVGIAAVQIGLTDVLRVLGLEPDNIIGHSVGELGCAYADGCLTAEETILAAYSRGLVSVQTPFIKGSMAAVGIGYEQIHNLCPPAIEVACHNGPESSTISGPADEMRLFVEELTAKKIFAKEVPCSNIAYHSRYIADAGPTLLKYLKEVIPNPKPRSDRWLSTSVPQDKWDQPQALYCSAEYHTNNLLSPVLFEETSRQVPPDAVLVEIAPHGLLQAILKRSLPASCCNIALTRRGHNDNAYLVLQAVGNLYMEGYNPKVEALYPKVEFPVSTGTPFLSHLIEWAHFEKWTMPLYVSAGTRTAAMTNFLISIHDTEHSYLRGNVVKGKILYPFSGALVAVWDTLAMSIGVERKKLSVDFSDVHLFAQPVLHEQRQLRLSVALHKGTGRFEIMDNNSQVATGQIVGNIPDFRRYYKKQFEDNKEETFNSDEIYQTLYERDYSYSGDFRSIHKINKSLTEAELEWSNNWVTFLDGIIQFQVLRQKHETVSQVCHIRRLCIDTHNHLTSVAKSNEMDIIKLNVCDEQQFIRCGGILINNISLRNVPLPEEELQLKPVISQHLGRLSQEMSLSKAGFTLRNSKIGDLNSLYWVEIPETNETGVMVNVKYAGLNTIDVQKATGVISTKHDATQKYGMDFSGLTESGIRVMGVVNGGAASSRVCALPELLWPVPAHWSLEDAATVPLAYANAFYCLGPKFLPSPTGKISVLVHGGAGALGQACISIALGLGYTVFTTVSDMRKKHFLRKLFPKLKENYIGNSRDHSFGDMVLSATNGVGCNIVISSVKGDLKNISLKCCSVYGAVIDTVQLPFREKFYYGMNNLFVEKAYYPVDFSSIFVDGQDDMKRIQIMLSEGIARGYVKPLSRITYNPLDVSRAFNLLALSRHRGRVLLDMQDATLSALSRVSCTSDGSHLVVSDDGQLGLKLAERLIKRGARNVLLHFQQPPINLTMKLSSWQNIANNVQVSSEKLNGSNGVINLLKKTLQLGPVEGIYIAITAANTKQQELSNIVASFDTASRNLCPSICNFAVLSSENLGLETCLKRVQDRLPATLLNLSGLKDREIEGLDMSWYRSAVEATEQALRSSEPILVIEKSNVRSTSLLHQLASIAGFEIPEDAPITATLAEMGLCCEKIQSVSVFLQDVHNVYLSEESIMALNIERIQQLDTISSSSPLKGLNSLFSHIHDDELLGTTEFVELPTLACGSPHIYEFEISQTYLYIIPGLEGQFERFRVMCERLKLPALVMQPGFDHVHETPQETAQRILRVLLKKGGLKNNFHLLGYENGILVALEIVSLLEKQGLTGTLFCLGGGPDEVLGEIEYQIREHKTEEDLQEAVLRHMYALIGNGNTVSLEKSLQGLSSWQSKLDVCVRMLLGHVSHSMQYIRSVIEYAYFKIKSARGYTAQPQALRSRIVVLRAAMDSVPAPNVPKVNEYSQQPIKTYQLTAPLTYIANDLQSTAIVNNHLDPEILMAFEQKNLCETYFIDVNDIMNNVSLDDLQNAV